MKGAEVFEDSSMPPHTLAPSTPPSDAIQVPDSSSMLHILQLYPGLFIFALLLYLFLRAKFPQYYILRIHRLNSRYVLTKSRDYLFYKERTTTEEQHNDENGTNGRSTTRGRSEREEENNLESGDVRAPLLESRRYEDYSTNVDVAGERNASGMSSSQRLSHRTVGEQQALQDTSHSLETTITSDNPFDGDDVGQQNQHSLPSELYEREASRARHDYEQYIQRNIVVRSFISLKNGVMNLLCILFATDKDIMDICGLDQLLTLRMIRLMIQLMLGYMVPSLLFLLPLYQLQPQEAYCNDYCTTFRMNGTTGDGHGKEESEDAYSSRCVCEFIDQSSLAMVKCTDSSFNLSINCLPLWGPVFGMYWCTLFTLWLLRREYKKIIYFRNNLYWLNRRPCELYTVLVDEIPSQLRLSTRQSIVDHFNTLFPDQVHNVDVVATTGKSNRILEKVRAVGDQREAVRVKLQQLVAYEDEETVCMARCQGGSCLWKKEEAKTYYEAQLKRQNELFEKVKERYLRESAKFEDISGDQVCLSVFVTFRSAVASTIAEQTLIHEQKNIVVVRAPEPSNVNFRWMGYSESNLTFRRYLSKFLFLLIILFWGTLTTAVTGLTKPQSLKKEFPSITDVFSKYEVLINLVAPLTLIILLSMVNPLIRFIATLHSRVSDSEIEEINTFYYFCFLVIQLFLFYGIAGTILAIVEKIIDNPKTLLYTIGQTIPKNAAFYISFIVTKMFTTLGLLLLRGTSAGMHLFRQICFSYDVTKEDVERVTWGFANLRYPTHNYLSSAKAELLLIYFIATTYITIQPLIAPTAFIFFVLAYIVYGNNYLNIALQRYDSGGASWPDIYFCFMTGIVTSQVTLIAVLIIKEGVEQVVTLWILFFFTIGASHIINGRYKKLLKSIPLNVAQRIDQSTKATVDVVPSAVWQYNRLIGPPNYIVQPAKKESIQGTSTVEVYSYAIPVLREATDIRVDA